MVLQGKNVSPQKIVQFTISLVILVSCLSVVAWQTWNCLEKYMEKPQGTKLSVEYTAGHIFPAITICVNPDNSIYNKDLLADCGVKMWVFF